MPLCAKIAAGFDFCAADPIAMGIEDLLYIFNKEDFTFTFDVDNPLLITGITRVGTSLMYKFTGSSNSFNATSTDKRTNVGNRWSEEVDFNMAGQSSAIKQIVSEMGIGKVQVIATNNYRDGDSIFELFGATTGLQSDGSKRDPSDENFGGGWQVKLTNPPKQTEPLPPRCVNLGMTPTYATTLAAIEALCVPAA